MKTGIIYRVTNHNGKKYIGQTIQELRKRKYHHLSDVRTGDKSYFHNAIRKYGEKNFKWEIIQRIDYKDGDFIETRKKLNEAEIYHIETENTLYPNGYNLQKGGGAYVRGLIPRKGKTFEEIFGPKEAQKIKKKMSKGIKGKTLGRKQPVEEVQKRAIANTGKKRTEETKEQTRNSLLGIKHTEERRKNISESLKGKMTGSKNLSYKKIPLDIQEKIIDLHINERWGSRKLEKEFNGKYSFRKILRFLREENLYTPIYR